MKWVPSHWNALLWVHCQNQPQGHVLSAEGFSQFGDWIGHCGRWQLLKLPGPKFFRDISLYQYLSWLASKLAARADPLKGGIICWWYRASFSRWAQHSVLVEITRPPPRRNTIQSFSGPCATVNYRFNFCGSLNCIVTLGLVKVGIVFGLLSKCCNAALSKFCFR